MSDDDAGIPGERIDKLFEKLETDPEKKGGTGLGLAIVKDVVEAHGGQLTVESKLQAIRPWLTDSFRKRHT